VPAKVLHNHPRHTAADPVVAALLRLGSVRSIPDKRYLWPYLGGHGPMACLL
jgi:hypothetical protein